MKNVFLSGILSFFTLGAFGAPALPFLRADRPSAVYQTGETIHFRVTGKSSGCVYTVNDGRKTTEPLPLSAEGITIKAERPGFILVTVTNPAEKGNSFAGAAIEPEKIAAAAELPADFDAFWEGELRQLREAPLEILKEAPVDPSLLPAGLAAYDVTIRRAGITATGFLAFRADIDRRDFPGVLTFLGASKVSAELPEAVRFAKAGAICFNLNFQGLENSPLPLRKFRETALYQNSARATAGYQYRDADDRGKYAMRKIFLRTVIAADYLRQRPEFDGRTLISAGGSLGGCQALVCAALVPEVTFCVSNATAMCDHCGKKQGHLPGWPNLLERVPAAEKTSAYFDVTNFTHRVKCPVNMAVGFIDVICPPASTYSVYNALTVPKKIMHCITSGHGGPCLDPKERGVFSCWQKEIADMLKGSEVRGK